MQSIDQIFERATIRGIVDYLLFGIGPNADHRSYEERLEEPYARFEKEVAKHDPSPSSKLLDLSNELTSETASVYTEIGLQIAMVLMKCNLRRAAATGAFASGHSAEHNGHLY